MTALPEDAKWLDIVQIAARVDGSVHTVRQALLSLHQADKLERRIEDGCAVYALPQAPAAPEVDQYAFAS